jgi:DNA-binding response OmpR family regulator
VLVEDNSDVAETLTALLKTAHHRVSLAPDGASAIELILRERPAAVLLDIGLPGMSGYDIARRLHRELGQSVPMLIALTGYGQQEDRKRGEEAGIHHYLVKPVDAERLFMLLGESA